MSSTSVQTSGESPRTGRWRNGPAAQVTSGILRLLSIHGLFVVLLVMIVVFSILLPSSFPTVFDLRSILSQQAVFALVALAVMVPLAAGQFDLSVGYLIGLADILAVGFQVRSGMGWVFAVLAVLGLGLTVGLANGLLVTRLGIDSFIATLGSGTILYGVSLWYTGGEQVSGNLGAGFNDLDNTVLGIPAPAIIAFIIAVLLWIFLEFLPVGRYMYVLGANPRAADLIGIRARRYVPLAFAMSGFLTAVAGLMLATELGVGQATIGPDYLLPAFAGALLGATSVRPGRVNTWGTVIAVLLLAVVVSGIEQLGAQSYVQPMFNGGILIVAVGLAGYAQRRRLEQRASDSSAAPHIIPPVPVEGPTSESV